VTRAALRSLRARLERRRAAHEHLRRLHIESASRKLLPESGIRAEAAPPAESR